MKQTKQAKQLGFWMLLALVTGNMIGSGIFLLPASLASLGNLSLWSWVFSAFGALLLAFVFSRMSRLVNIPGGPYIYAQAGFGKFIGFQMAFYYWFALWIGNAAIAVACTSYMHLFFPALTDPSVRTITSIALVWLLTIINCIGVKEAGFVQVISTVLKLIPLFIVAIFGWFYFNYDNLISTPNLTNGGSDLGVFTAGVAFTLWAFIGVESATVPSDCVLNPKRNIPLATILGTLLAAIVYIASSIAIAGMIPGVELRTSMAPFADAANIMFGSWGGTMVAVGAIISCFGALNGWTLLVGQVGKSAANNGLFPKFMGISTKNGTPVVSLLVSSSLITLVLLRTLNHSVVDQFNAVVLMAVLGSLLPYLFTCMALLIVSRNKVKGGNSWVNYIVVGGALVYVIWAIFGVGVTMIFYSMILFVVSVILYYFSQISHSKVL